MRIVVMGNAGSGKTTLARRLAARHGLAVLALDAIAFRPGTAERRPLAESLAELERFLASTDRWVVEGCYGDLLAAALHRCTELRFLDPGVEACVAHCRARPFEPDKFATEAEQRAMLDALTAWVREYPARTDELGRPRHLALFEAFEGKKHRHTDPASYGS